MQRGGRGFSRRGAPVQDLREKLNRQRQERSTQDSNFSESKVPPPDPVFNFLKDPLRGDCVEEQKNQSKKVTFARHVDNRRNYPKPNCPWKTARKAPTYEENSFSNPYQNDGPDSSEKEINSGELERKNGDDCRVREVNNVDRKYANIIVVLRRGGGRTCLVDKTNILNLVKENKNKHNFRDKSKQQKQAKEDGLLEACCPYLNNLTVTGQAVKN